MNDDLNLTPNQRSAPAPENRAVWLPLHDFPGYEVASNGTNPEYTAVVRCWTYRGQRLNNPRPITPRLQTNTKRWVVALYDAEGRQCLRALAKLVLETHGNPPGPHQTDVVDYLDGDSYNVHIDNLTWRNSYKAGEPDPSRDSCPYDGFQE